MNTPIIGAIGHVEEKIFIKQLVDKCAPTPNGLGQYFSEMVESVSEKKTKSRAALTEQIKKVVVPAEYMQWKAGYEYTYKFKVTEKGDITIEVVQVAINEWGNRRVSEHVVYNW